MHLLWTASCNQYLKGKKIKQKTPPRRFELNRGGGNDLFQTTLSLELEVDNDLTGTSPPGSHYVHVTKAAKGVAPRISLLC
jgi:hypothetical protein